MFPAPQGRSICIPSLGFLDAFRPSFWTGPLLSFSLRFHHALLGQCPLLTHFLFSVVFSWRFSMAATEDSPLKPALNEVEEDRALLLHTHRNWRRSLQAGIRENGPPEDAQSTHTTPPSSQDFFQIDLREADFRHQDLRNANFQEAYLPGANFEGANLRGANFQGANLRSVRFRSAQLAWANFSQADLIWADFQQAELQGTDFQHATLRGATFVRAQIRGGNFFSSDCSWADFRDTDLHESDFQQANLNGTTFINAQTTGANFQSSLGFYNSPMTDSSPPSGDPLFP